MLKFFPYLKNTKKMTDKQKETVKSFDDKKKVDLHNKVFGTNIVYCNCPDILKSVSERLEIALIYQEL